jgi:SAM-dependent methyltransferase
MTEAPADKRPFPPSWERLLPILRCPASRGRLSLEGSSLVSEAGHRYGFVSGKPVLVVRPAAWSLEVPPVEKVSRTIDEYRIPEQFAASAARALHLGSGNVPCKDERVVSCDLLPNEHVDVVAEAECLPFADETFDYVESGAAFEHVHDPLVAIREVKRVLRPGGRMLINTGFLCAYHGYPGHFFNMTPQAVETHLLDDFHIEESTVPDAATPATSVLGIVELLLDYLSTAHREELLSLPLRDALERLRQSQSKGSALMRDLSEYSMRALSATFLVVGRKPDDYEGRRRSFANREATEDWAAKKREYYAARMGVMFRHHEVDLYRRLAREQSPGAAIASGAPRDLASILADGIADPMSTGDLERSTGVLSAAERDLATVREQWIHEYLTRKESRRRMEAMALRLRLASERDDRAGRLATSVAVPGASGPLGPDVDDLFRAEDMVSRRESMAAEFLRGDGVEIGALHCCRAGCLVAFRASWVMGIAACASGSTKTMAIA